MLPVSTENLVGTHPAQEHDRPVLAGRLGDEVRVDRRRIEDRLVEVPNDLWQKADDVG